MRNAAECEELLRMLATIQNDVRLVACADMLKEISSKLGEALAAATQAEAFHAAATERERKLLADHNALVDRLQASEKCQLAAQNAAIDLSRRLDAALKFVNYIAKRYEEDWDEPITQRFYNEAVEFLKESPGLMKTERGERSPDRPARSSTAAGGMQSVTDLETCDHEWIDIRNMVVESGEMCSKCRALRPGNTTAVERLCPLCGANPCGCPSDRP